MELNKLFEVIEETKESANWRAAFGEPQVVDDKIIIPVATVTYGFGLGFGEGSYPVDVDSKVEEDPAAPPGREGQGVGGGAITKPLGAIVVTPEGVTFEEAPDATRVALGAFLMGGLFIYQLAKTLRALFGKD